MKHNFRTLLSNRQSRQLFSVSSLVNVILIIIFCWISDTNSLYSNHFAVHVPSGAARAADIAQEYGFINMGQV